MPVDVRISSGDQMDQWQNNEGQTYIVDDTKVRLKRGSATVRIRCIRGLHSCFSVK